MAADERPPKHKSAHHELLYNKEIFSSGHFLYVKDRMTALNLPPKPHPSTLHVAQPQVIEGTWRLKIPKTRACEHPRLLESHPCILADEESKSPSRPCDASPHFTSIPLILAKIQISH